MDTPRPWPHRFVAALVPGERGIVLFFLLMAFACGVLLGLQLAATREVDRISGEVTRRVSEVQTSPRPTLHQRLDAIEHRLQAIEQRLTP